MSLEALPDRQPPRFPAWPWLLLLALAVLATVPFWLTDLDLRAASHFYRAAPLELGHDASWPLGQAPLYRALYRLGSSLSWITLAATVLVFLLPQLRRRPLLRHVALTALATAVLGSGLLVNVLGKDMTGRPRPRAVTEFHGQSHYRRPLELGTPGTGKSFPCGHCSAGFAVGAIGLALVAARPVLGSGIIITSLLLGGFIGAARMAAGGHFLSDVLWSAVLTWTAALLSHQWLSRAQAGQKLVAWPPWLRNGLIGAMVLLVFSGLIFVRPFQQRVQATLPMPATGQPMPRIQLDLDAADLNIRTDPAQADALRLQGLVKGVGLPGVRIEQRVDTSTPGVWRYRLHRIGRSREIEAPIVVSLRPEAVPSLHAQVRLGSLVAPPELKSRLGYPTVDIARPSGNASEE